MGDSEQPTLGGGTCFVAASHTGAMFASGVVSNSSVTVTNLVFNNCIITSESVLSTGQGGGEIGGADDDERKELINSFSGSHDVHLDGNPQDGDRGLAPDAEAGATSGRPTPTHLTPNTTRRHFAVYEEEVSISDASDTYVKVDIEDAVRNSPVLSCEDEQRIEELLEEAMHDISSVPSSTEIGQYFAEVDEDIAVGEPSETPLLQPPFVPAVPIVGSPMPPESSCKISPHPCSVFSSRVCRCLRPFGKVGRVFREETKSSRRVCLVGNALCISSTTRNVIECVVDLAEEALCLEGCDLTIGRWVIALPESMLSEWKSVSVGIKSRTAPGCPQWSSSPDIRAEAKRKSRSLPQASSVADLLEDNEVTKPEECQGTDEPVPVFKSTASMHSSTTDL